MRVVARLSCKRIDDGRDVDLACSVHLLVNIGGDVLAAFLKEGDVGRVAQLGDDLQGWVYLLNGFVNEDVLGVEHLICHRLVLLLDQAWIVAQDHSLSGSLDLRQAQDF